MEELLVHGEVTMIAAAVILGVVCLLTVAIAFARAHELRRREERLDRAFLRAQQYRNHGTVCEGRAFGLGIAPARYIHS